MGFKNRSIISIYDFSKEDILHILKIAKQLEATPNPNLLKDKVLATLFFEPSTRTRLSFESAMSRLGGKVIGFAEPGISSAKKGETVKDTAHMVEQYSDVIVMRHFLEGAARAASELIKIPVINGGDGANQHPTQTLLDLYTIQKTQGKLDGLHIAMCGDLKYGRTTHSLAVALTHFNCRISFVAPKSLQMPAYILEHLEEKGIPYSLHERMEGVLDQVDILYCTRIQKERFPVEVDYEKVKNQYILKRSMLGCVKPTMKILHPLPRVNEIHPDVDDTPHAVYFEQAGNGIPVRQALLALVLGVIE